jgi:hypothetical protein
MSFVIASPELITAAATDLANIGSTITAAYAAAAPTTVVASAPAYAKGCAGVLTGAPDCRCSTPTSPELRPAPTIYRCGSSTIQTTPTVPTQQASGSSRPGPVRNS